LAALSDVGRDALRFLASSQLPPSGWQTDSLKKLAAAERTDDFVVFTFIAPLRQLIFVAGGQREGAEINTSN
jgi:hypothetical protein